jgi:hypothetical protein
MKLLLYPISLREPAQWILRTSVLVGGVYKIISKVLANRLKSVLGKIIFKFIECVH